MTTTSKTKALRIGLLLVTVCGSALVHAGVEAEAAEALARKNNCFKCHAIDKTKKAPSYRKIAAKWNGKVDAESALITHITTGPKVKLEDETEETHRIIETKDEQELGNLVRWILSL